MRPIIGITSYAEQARWGVWDAPAALIPMAYVHAIERAGGRALLVPPSEDAVEETLDALEKCLADWRVGPAAEIPRWPPPPASPGRETIAMRD